MLKGIDVTLLEKTKSGIDKYNRPIYTTVPVVIHDVLVAPTSTDEQRESLEMDNRRAIYTLAIPKTDTHTWEGQKVEFFGETWDVIGIPTKGIDHLIPLKWNMKVRVARNE